MLAGIWRLDDSYTDAARARKAEFVTSRSHGNLEASPDETRLPDHDIQLTVSRDMKTVNNTISAWTANHMHAAGVQLKPEILCMDRIFQNLIFSS